MLNILESDKVNLFKLFLAVMGVVLIGYVGLYYCGWIVITELIDYAECDWECIGKKEIAWAVFRIAILLEISTAMGIWLIIFGVIRR